MTDLENQADSDSDDSDDGVYNSNGRLAVKQRIWWLVRAFMWFSALFFPISMLNDYGFLSPRPPANSFSADYESGLPSIRRIEL